ncbi:MAG: class I adenylate-forming enzyme family protein [Clostridia bacterium]|nr:class I adenylate-forming enzyme family protein [Clostridia bacterium]
MSSDARWFKYYGDIPHTLDYPDISMYRMIKNTKEKYPEYIAYDFMGKAVSYSEFLDEVEVCAKALVEQNIGEGDTVTVCLPNVPQAVIMFYAINRIGAVASMVHPLSAENEILFYLKESNSKIAITLSQFYNKFEAIKDNCNVEKVIVATIGEALPSVKGFFYKYIGHEPKIKNDGWAVSWKDFISKGKNSGIEIKYEGRGDDSAVILFSGGTTGTSKGILLTNLNFNALAMQTDAASECLAAGDVMLSVMPVFHGFGLGIGIHTMLAFGGKCVLIPRLNVAEFPGLFKKHRPNYMAGVPTLFEAMMRNEDMNKADLSCMKGLFSGGDSLSVELKKKIDTFMKERGATIQVREGYGTTECVTASCLTPSSYYREGSIGIPFPDTYYKIVIPNTNEEAAIGEMGEICLTGPTLMKEYINNPKETGQTLRMHDDGKIYLHTGDLGKMDEDGFIYFVQRLKRMIITNGYNVYPSQIENVIDAHEAVMFSTVIGVKDDYSMQRVKAFVVLKPEFSPTDEIRESIKAHCEKNIAKYALPKEYEYRESLPKTLVGKVAYRELEKEEEEKLLVK